MAVDVDGRHLAVERVLGRPAARAARWSRSAGRPRAAPPSARSAATSALSVCAGRPFFIRIGVSQASERPAASSAAITSGHSRGSRSSTLVSSSSGATGGRGREPSGSSLARPAAAARWRGPRGRGRRRRRRSRRRSSPAAGRSRGAAWSAARRRSACTARASTGPAYDGTPRSSSATAGGGTGRRAVRAARPCREPTATGRDHDRGRARGGRSRRRPRRRRRSRRARRPRGSARRRRVVAVHRGPRRRRAARRRVARASRTSLVQRGAREQRPDVAPGAVRRRSRRPRRGTRVAAKPLRRHRPRRRGVTGSGRDRVDRRAAARRAGTPAPTRAPSSMSPLAPEEASTQTDHGLSRSSRCGVAGHPGGEHAGAVPVVDVDHA